MFGRLIILCVFLAFPLTTQAAVPSFDLNFTFNPPMTITPATPLTYLDVCSNPGCTAQAGTMGLTCPAVVNPVTHAVYAERCNVRVMPAPGNAAVMLLANPAYLRLRNGNLISPPFYFAGGQPAIPPRVMHYMVSPSPTGFVVTAR